MDGSHGSAPAGYWETSARVREEDQRGGSRPRIRGSILLVDDDAKVRDGLGRLLFMRGYKVRSVASGEAALEALAEAGADLVILDVHMHPGMDGLEACRRIRALPGGQAVQVLVLTGSIQEGMEEAVAECGADDLLFKPVQFPELLVRVRSMLRASAAAASLQRSLELIRIQQEQIEKARRHREDASAFLAHDLKHPLTAIQLKAELALRRAAAGDPAREDWRAVLEASARACGLLSDWLDLAYLEGGFDLDRRPVALVPWLRGLRESLAPWLGHKELQLRVHCDGEVRELAMDERLMTRVLNNLLDNAVSFSPRGGSLGLEVLAAPEGRVGIVVSDEGPGIPPEAREAVFEAGRGGRLDGRARHQGLGLAFCRMARWRPTGAASGRRPRTGDPARPSASSCPRPRARRHSRYPGAWTATPTGNTSIPRRGTRSAGTSPPPPCPWT